MSKNEKINLAYNLLRSGKTLCYTGEFTPENVLNCVGTKKYIYFDYSTCNKKPFFYFYGCGSSAIEPTKTALRWFIKTIAHNLSYDFSVVPKGQLYI